MDDPLAVQGLCLGLLMLSAHFFGRLTLKLRLGQVIGQLLGGVFVSERALLAEAMRQGRAEELLRPPGQQAAAEPS